MPFVTACKNQKCQRVCERGSQPVQVDGPAAGYCTSLQALSCDDVLLWKFTHGQPHRRTSPHWFPDTSHDILRYHRISKISYDILVFQYILWYHSISRISNDILVYSRIFYDIIVYPEYHMIFQYIPDTWYSSIFPDIMDVPCQLGQAKPSQKIKNRISMISYDILGCHKWYLWYPMISYRISMISWNVNIPQDILEYPMVYPCRISHDIKDIYRYSRISMIYQWYPRISWDILGPRVYRADSDLLAKKMETSIWRPPARNHRTLWTPTDRVIQANKGHQ